MSDDGFGNNVLIEEDDGTGSNSNSTTPGGAADRNEDSVNKPPSRQNTGSSGGLKKQSSLTGNQHAISISGPEPDSNTSGNFTNDLTVSTATALPMSPSASLQAPSPGRPQSTQFLSIGFNDGFGQQVTSTANSPAFGGAEYVSFRSSNNSAAGGNGGNGGRRSASMMSGISSNVSGVFVSANGEDDDDEQQARSAGGIGGDPCGGGSGHNKKKMLPQQMQCDEDLAEELNMELLHVVEEQCSDCNLSKLNIQRVPQDIRTFSWLKQLFLAENRIAILPDTIFIQMQLLEVLDLRENHLTTVPRSIFQLKSLRRLLLDHNRIYSLPDEIDPDPVESFGVPELIEIGLEWNNLMRFPVNLLIYGPRLERMFLSENPGISHLPPPALLEPRKNLGLKQTVIRLDNRPMLLQAAASSDVYNAESGVVQLEWNKIYPDRVLDFLYLGSMRTAQCVEVYNDLDIGYVLTAARNLDVVLGPGMKHLTLPFDDLPGEDISHFFESSFKFIDEAVAAKRGILIHCFAGLSRSVAMTIGYLMKKFKISADDALALVRQSRPAAHPNEGFVNRLRSYSKELGITPESSATIRAELERMNNR